MAKSLGNGYTLSDLEGKGFNAMDFRVLALQSHYRTQANFTWKILEDAKARRKRYYRLAEKYLYQYSQETKNDASYIQNFENAQQRILDALADDLNTPQALTALDEIPPTPIAFSSAVAEKATSFFQFIDSAFGLTIMEQVTDLSAKQKKLLQQRTEAKKNGDYQTADTIREQLQQQGIQLDDVNERTEWGRSEFR